MIKLTNTEKTLINLCKLNIPKYNIYNNRMDILKAFYKDIYGYDLKEYPDMYDCFLGTIFDILLKLQLKISNDQSGNNIQLLNIFNAAFSKSMMRPDDLPIERAISELYGLIQCNTVLNKDGSKRYDIPSIKKTMIKHLITILTKRKIVISTNKYQHILLYNLMIEHVKKHGCENKYLKKTVYNNNITKFHHKANYICYACEEVTDKYGDKWCSNCPIKWVNNKPNIYAICEQNHYSVYYKLLIAYDNKQTKKVITLLEEIRDLWK